MRCPRRPLSAQNLFDQALWTERQPDLAMRTGVQGKPGTGARGKLDYRAAMHEIEHHQIIIQQSAERYSLPRCIPKPVQRVAGDGDDLEIATRGFAEHHQLDPNRIATGAHIAPHEAVTRERAEMAVDRRFRR